jgi:hypothetical protein
MVWMGVEQVSMRIYRGHRGRRNYPALRELEKQTS